MRPRSRDRDSRAMTPTTMLTAPQRLPQQPTTPPEPEPVPATAPEATTAPDAPEPTLRRARTAPPSRLPRRWEEL